MKDSPINTLLRQELFCSFSKTGRFDERGQEITTTGHCCPAGTYWEEGEGCIQRAASPCSCGFNPTQAEFWDPDSGCLDLRNHLACVKTKLFSSEEEELKIEIVER